MRNSRAFVAPVSDELGEDSSISRDVELGEIPVATSDATAAVTPERGRVRESSSDGYYGIYGMSHDNPLAEGGGFNSITISGSTADLVDDFARKKALFDKVSELKKVRLAYSNQRSAQMRVSDVKQHPCCRPAGVTDGTRQFHTAQHSWRSPC